MAVPPLSNPHVALLPWGHTIEDFLDALGVSFESFCSEMTGGWLFGYVTALKMAGVRTSIFCISSRSLRVSQSIHKPTSGEIFLIPASALYRSLRTPFADPYAWETAAMFAGTKTHPRLWRLLRDILPYTATPLYALLRELKRRRVNALLCQEYEYARFDIVVLLGRLLGVPTFATFQGGTWHSSRIESWVRPRTILRSAGLIIGPRDEAQRVKARYHLGEEKIARVPNPLDLHLWRPIERASARRELGLSMEQRIVICHGRIDVHRKGLDVLLAAWADVRAKCPSLDAQLILIGSGEDATNFSELLATQGSAQITWLSEYIQDRSLMRMWLSAANLYVMASRHEGFPVAPLEAMACGLPIIITDVPGSADIMGSEDALPGVVVPVGDSAALARALIKLLTDPAACEHFSGRALNRVRDFSIEGIGIRLRAFLFGNEAPTTA